jgi:uncharacterized SAM-binding protein YcdF (DUF218 family)
VSVYFIIFGAAVRDDGRPSGTLRRRVESALRAGRGEANPIFVPTGGAGKNGFVEAEAMRDLLRAAGAPAADILLEPNARDTLESVRFVDALLRTQGCVERVVPCTSRYHLPRCWLLLRLAGWPVRLAPMQGDLGRLPARRLARFWLKELVATPYDAALLLAWRMFRRRKP